METVMAIITHHALAAELDQVPLLSAPAVPDLLTEVSHA
jgi:hypothetical protein